MVLWWLSLLFLLALGALGGALFCVPVYCVSRWLRRASPRFARGLDLVLALLGVPMFNANLLFVLPVCILGARAARSQEITPHSLLFHVTQILSCAALATIALTIGWLTLPVLFPASYAALTALSDHFLVKEVQVVFLWMGTFIGFALAPSLLGLRNAAAFLKMQRAAMT